MSTPLSLKRRHVAAHHELYQLVVRIDQTVLHEGDKELTMLFEHLELRVLCGDPALVAVGVDGGGGADHADLAVLGDLCRGKAGGVDDAGVGETQLLAEVGRDRADGAAGGDDHLDAHLFEEARVLPGIFADGVAALAAVGHASRVAEVDDIFLRHDLLDLAHGGQTAESRVKNADGGLLVHMITSFQPPFPKGGGTKCRRVAV